MQSGFIVSSSASLYKSGLHGWTDNLEKAYRFSRLSQAANYIRLHARAQQDELHILEEIQIDGQVDYIQHHLDEI